jgi:hypothetical protein
MASTILRSATVRGRPRCGGEGMNGSIKAHSASVRSLASRYPTRQYRCRAISVKAIVSPFVIANELNHNPLKSLNYLLRSGSEKLDTDDQLAFSFVASVNKPIEP